MREHKDLVTLEARHYSYDVREDACQIVIATLLCVCTCLTCVHVAITALTAFVETVPIDI